MGTHIGMNCTAKVKMAKTRSVRHRRVGLLLIGLIFLLPTTHGYAQDESIDAASPAQQNANPLNADATTSFPSSGIPANASAASPDGGQGTSPINIGGNHPEDHHESKNRFIEEIIVTAQKRAENVQDVPIAIAAFSEGQLAAQGVKDTSDLQTLVPGLSFNGIVGFTQIYLRGIGSEAFVPTVDPAVATYVDGMYIPANQGVFTSLGGVQRVEVVKGPQGTLFGRNAVAGAISVTTKDPAPQAELSTSLEVGNYNDKKAQIYASYPITDSLGVAVSGLYNSNHSEYKVVGAPNSLYPAPDYQLKPDRTGGGRLRLKWQPIESLSFTLTGSLIRSAVGGSAVSQLVHASLLSKALDFPVTTTPRETSENSEPVEDFKNMLLYANANWSLPWLDMKFIGGHENIHAKANIDFDGTQANLVTFSTNNSLNLLTTAELQFISNEGTWGSKWLKFVAGLYALREKAGYDPVYLGVAGGGANSNVPLFGLVPEAVYNQLLAGILPSSVPTLPGPGVRVGVEGVLGTKAYSGFAQTDVILTDWFTLTLGGRYQYEQRYIIKQDVGVDDVGGGTTAIFQFDQPPQDFTNFSPKITATVKPMDDVIVYATYAKAFKSGTYNVITVYTPPGYVKPEQVTSFEFGEKSELFDRALKLNAAVFDSELKDQQVQYVSLTNGGAVTLQNAGAARSRGAEFDAQWNIFQALDPGLVLSGGGTYLDAVYSQFNPASGFSDKTGLFFQNGDFTGNRIAKVPKFSGNAGLSQTLSVWRGSIEFSADAYYNSGFFYTAQNTIYAKQDAYTLLNGRISYLYEPWSLRFTAFGQNLLNTLYTNSSFTADFGTTYTYASARTYGLRLELVF